MKGHGRKLLALLLSIVMLTSLCSSVVFAEGGDTTPNEETTLCQLTEGCTLEDGHEGDCVLETQTDPEPNANEELAALQTRIDALPDAAALEGMSDENKMEAYNEMLAIYDAIDALEEGADTLDIANLNAAAEWFKNIYPGLTAVNDDDGTATPFSIGNKLDVVYVGGTGGDDNNSGKSADEPFKTLAHAYDMVSGNGVIYVCGTVTVEKSLTLDGVKIERYEKFKQDNKGLIETAGVNNGETGVNLTLTNVTIDGRRDITGYISSSSLISVGRGSTVTLGQGTVLQNNSDTAVYVNQATANQPRGNLIIDGAKITNNGSNNNNDNPYWGSSGGGVYNGGYVEMRSGEISGNTAVSGGGIHNNANGEVLLRGGEIKNNTAYDGGGGISIVDGTVTLYGAIITGNSAGAGGGVNVHMVPGDVDDRNVFEMKSGTLSGNSATGTGAEIYAWNYGYGEIIIRVSGGTLGSDADDPYLVTFFLDPDYYGSTQNVSLELSGSPDITGSVFLWDTANDPAKGRIKVTGNFTPVKPVVINRLSNQNGVTAVAYDSGLTPDLNDFTEYRWRDVLAVDADANTLIWGDAAYVYFYDENRKEYSGTRTTVIKGNGIDASQVPNVSKTGYTVEGWYIQGTNTKWNFETDTVSDTTRLQVRWALNAPKSVEVTAETTKPHGGASATLTATPSHVLEGVTYTYQWYKDGEPINGATGSTLSVIESGSYTVRVKAINGTDESEETESAAMIITAEGHAYVPVVTPPTCTQQGYTTWTCSVCGSSYVEDYTDPTGHSFEAEWSHDASGHWQVCETCGAASEKSAHAFAWVTDKTATATEAGSKHEECSVCGYEKAPVEIPATGTAAPPQTGDTSRTTLLLALLLASGAVLTAAALVSLRRKYSR